MHNTRNVRPPLTGWAGYPAGFAAAVGVTLVAVAAHGAGHPQWTLGALAVVAAAVAALTTLPAALATAALCWALHAGFVLGRYGDLALTAGSARAAALLVAVALLAWGVAAAVRLIRSADRTAPVPAPRPAPVVQVLGSVGPGRHS